MAECSRFRCKGRRKGVSYITATQKGLFLHCACGGTTKVVAPALPDAAELARGLSRLQARSDQNMKSIQENFEARMKNPSSITVRKRLLKQLTQESKRASDLARKRDALESSQKYV